MQNILVVSFSNDLKDHCIHFQSLRRFLCQTPATASSRPSNTWGNAFGMSVMLHLFKMPTDQRPSGSIKTTMPYISAAHVLVSELSLLIYSFWVWQTPGKMKYSVYSENNFTAFVRSTSAKIWNWHSQGISGRHNHCFDTTVPQQKWHHITFLLTFALCPHFR